MSCKKLGAFIAGGLVGAGIALLFAPRTGLETRACVRTHAQNLQDAATQMSNNAHIQGQKLISQINSAGQEAATNAGEKSREIISQAQEKGNEFVSNIAENITGKKSYFAESSDDLRSKIEEARRRIASQVAQNAQESATSHASLIREDAGEACIDAQACGMEDASASHVENDIVENAEASQAPTGPALVSQDEEPRAQESSNEA